MTAVTASRGSAQNTGSFAYAPAQVVFPRVSNLNLEKIHGAMLHIDTNYGSLFKGMNE